METGTASLANIGLGGRGQLRRHALGHPTGRRSAPVSLVESVYNNSVERLNKETRRRTNVVGVVSNRRTG